MPASPRRLPRRVDRKLPAPPTSAIGRGKASQRDFPKYSQEL
jgi:hypothetical protein